MVTDSALTCLGDPIRRRIVRRLSAAPCTVNEIAAGFEISRPAISRHLRLLRESGVVSERRSGRQRIYRIEPAALREAAAWLMDVAAEPPPPVAQSGSDEDVERASQGASRRLRDEPPDQLPEEPPEEPHGEPFEGPPREPYRQASTPSGSNWREW